LSGDVECLKWQAYLALRGLDGIKVRWDIAPEGSVGESLPNLHVPSDSSKKSEGAEEGALLSANSILAWVDTKLGVDSTADPLEGYKDEGTRTESRAWISLLESTVHAALVSRHST
jgi:metaxin